MFADIYTYITKKKNKPARTKVLTGYIFECFYRSAATASVDNILFVGWYASCIPLCESNAHLLSIVRCPESETTPVPIKNGGSSDAASRIPYKARNFFILVGLSGVYTTYISILTTHV